MSNRVKLILMTLVLTVLSGCVTVTESRFTKKKSPEKAVENYTQLGLGYLRQGRPDLARQRLQKALSIDEDNAPANDAMGLVWQSESEFDLAEEFFRKAIKQDPDFTLARHHLGRLFTQLKRYQEAETWLQQAADDRYYENRPAAFNDLALNDYRQEDNASAIANYLETLRLMPYNVDALVNVSTLQFEAQSYDESIKYFDRLDRLVQRGNSQHTSHSLWLGIKLSTLFQQTDRVIELATRLKTTYPESNEYRLYQESLSDASALENH